MAKKKNAVVKTKAVAKPIAVVFLELTVEFDDLQGKIERLENPKEYLLASGYEALIGYLYLKKDQSRLDEIISKMGLSDVLNKRAKTLSGGYQRRLSIAIALMSKPEIIFLDEPTLGLDVIARRELWKIVSKFKGKITIILTSHYLEEIEALCDRVAILSKGNLLIEGTIDEIKEKTNESSFEEAFVKIVGGIE